MADIRVRSTDGDNADNGSTWTLAKLDLHTATIGALAAAGSGGTCYVSDNHAGSYSVAPLYQGGTIAAPIKIICGDDSADPPTASAVTATETTTASGYTWQGSFYWKGISFITTYGSTVQFNWNGYLGPYTQIFDDCSFEGGGGNAGGHRIGNTTLTANDKGLRLVWNNCDVKLPNTASGAVFLYNADFTWNGGAVLTNTTMPTYLFVPNQGYYHNVRVIGVDLTEMSGKTLVNAGAATSGLMDIQFINCKLPASITLSTAPVTTTQRVALYNSDSGDTGLPTRMEVQTYAGGIYSETTLVRTGGASDGTTTHSWKMVTNANAEFPTIPLISDPIYVWNDTVGSSKTITVEILHDSATALTDQEIWLEVAYSGTSGFPTASFNSIDDPLSSASDTPDSTETWTTTGMSNPNTRKLTYTFTPQEIGYVTVKVNVGKASTTVYVDPKATIS